MNTNVIKCRFLKDGKPSGHEYTYYTDTGRSDDKNKILEEAINE